MAQRIYHIIFETTDGKTVEADVEVIYTPGESFDSFAWDDVMVTDQKTGLTEDYGIHLPEEYRSEAEYEAEGSLPLE